MIIMQEAKDPNKKDDRLNQLINAIKQKKLLTVVIEVSSKCNLKCEFCDAHAIREIPTEFQKQAGIMSKSTLECYSK